MPNPFADLPVPLDLNDLSRRTPPWPFAQQVLQNTQGHILAKHRRDHVWNLLLRFNDTASARPALASALAKLTIPSVHHLFEEGSDIRLALSENREPEVLSPVCFVGISAPGCDLLRLPATGFPPEFHRGFQSLPLALHINAAWTGHWSGSRVHAVLVCAAATPGEAQAVTQMVAAQLGSAADVTLETSAVIRDPKLQRPGQSRPPAIEHFGFADGISQPVFFLDGNQRVPGRWTSSYDPKAELDLALLPDPWTADAFSFGSYMAYLRIEQHPERMDDAAAKLAACLHTSPDDAKQFIVGRKQDGTPLVGGTGGLNDFDRSQDPNGASFPFASHVSKMSVREGTDLPRRIIRRGVTFEENGVKGLLFQSFQRDLVAQFEAHLAAWADNPNHPRPAAGLDPVLASRPSTFTYKCPVGMSPLVTVRGGEYFFFPSIKTLRAL